VDFHRQIAQIDLIYNRFRASAGFTELLNPNLLSMVDLIIAGR